MKKNTLNTVLIIIVLLSTTILFAQNPPTNRPPVPPGLPIDGGLFTLAAVAFGYGVSKIKKNK